MVFALCFQILTGLSMAIHYLPTTASAFESINEFVRKFKYGWLVRSAHANGASLFFLFLFFLRFVYSRLQASLLQVVHWFEKAGVSGWKCNVYPCFERKLHRLRVAVEPTVLLSRCCRNKLC